MVCLLKLSWRYVSNGTVQALLVVPMDPASGRQLELLERPPRSLLSDELSLVKAVDGLRQRVVIGVPARPDRAHGAGLGEPFGIADGQVLDAAVGVMNQAFEVDRASSPDRHLKGIQRELCSQRGRDLPTDDVATENIGDKGDVGDAGPGAEVGGVGPPG